MSLRTISSLQVIELETREVPAASFETLPIFPFTDSGALDNARAIASLGATLGRRTDVFMKVGDSNTDFGFKDNGYLIPLGMPGYNPVASGLASQGQNLVDTWATFVRPVNGSILNSFNRSSTTANAGFTTVNVLSSLQSEIAATNAGVALITIGTNDITVYAGDKSGFVARLTAILSQLETAGIVPILSTIPDNHYSNGMLHSSVLEYNQAIADLAGTLHIPLWNLFTETASLANAGLDLYGFHLTFNDGFLGNFTPIGLLLGQNVHTLGALTMLDWYRRSVVGSGPDFVSPSASWAPVAVGESIYATGRGAGQAPIVSIYDVKNNTELTHFYAYEASFRGGVQVATADVDGDGIRDIITAPGAGGGPVVKVFSGKDGSLLGSLMVFEPTFRTGVNVTAADLDGDGKSEVIVGAGNGGGPAIAVYHGGDLNELERFFAYEPSFRGGVNVAAAVLPNYGPAIVAGSGVGGGPVVKVFRFGESTPAASFLAYDISARAGVNVAAGVITGYGAAEIVTAPGSGSTHVNVIDAITNQVQNSFFAGAPTAPGGVQIAVVDGRLLVGNGPGQSVCVLAYDSTSAQPVSLLPNDPLRAYGLDVG